MKRIINFVLVAACLQSLVFAQGLRLSEIDRDYVKKQFDELWSKADSSSKIVIKTGNSTKDLNAQERNNIESVDIKQKTVTNPNYNFKKIDTSNLDALSSKPIIKGTSTKSKTTSKTSEVKETKLKEAAAPVKDAATKTTDALKK